MECSGLEVQPMGGSNCFYISTEIGLSVGVESFWVFLVLGVEGIALWKVVVWISEVVSHAKIFNTIFIHTFDNFSLIHE